MFVVLPFFKKMQSYLHGAGGGGGYQPGTDQKKEEKCQQLQPFPIFVSDSTKCDFDVLVVVLFCFCLMLRKHYHINCIHIGGHL